MLINKHNMFLLMKIFASLSVIYGQNFQTVNDYQLEIQEEERTIISYDYENRYVENNEYRYETRTATYDLSDYFLNKKNGITFFQNYDDGFVYWYPTVEGTVHPAYTHGSIIGLDNDLLFFYTWRSGAANAAINYKIIDNVVEKKGGFCNCISSRSGLPPEYRERLYMIRHVKDKCFVATSAIDESADFVWNFLRISDQGTERTNYPKRSYLPFPQRNVDPFPTKIYELDLFGPFGFSIVDDEDKEIQSEFSSRPLPMNFSDYGIGGDLQVDSLFKIQELIDYSDYLDSYVFVGRVSRDGILPESEYNDAFWEGEDILPVKAQNYDEYLFLIDKSGGKPKPILKIEEGHKVEDLLFSPEGEKLVVEIDRELYVLTFPEDINPIMINWAREGIPSAEPEKLDSSLKDYLDNCGKEDLRRFRNAMFALMGYQFRSPELTQYFNTYPWYHPNTDVIADPERLSEKQKNLLEIIQEYEEN